MDYKVFYKEIDKDMAAKIATFKYKVDAIEYCKMMPNIRDGKKVIYFYTSKI